MILDKHLVNCETGEVSIVAMTPEEIADVQALQTAEQARQQAAAQQAMAAKQQTIDRFTATFHALNAMGGTAAAVPMLELALGLAQTIGADLRPSDLPADLQAALASPPS